MHTPPEHLLDEVLALALEARDNGEVPVGALVCRGPEEGDTPWTVLGRGRNRILESRDPTAHAENLALREACASVDSERLEHSVLITSLEPCLMCSGALILARIETVFYFAPVQSGTGLLDIINLPPTRHKPLNHSPRAIQIDARLEDSSSLLRDFFREKRRKKSE